MTSRLYLAGPMTGLPELNFPAFHAEAARLRALGYEVVNPAEINVDPAAGWLACMRADIAQLVDQPPILSAAADRSEVNNRLDIIEANFSDLTAKTNKALTVVRTFGLMAT